MKIRRKKHRILQGAAPGTLKIDPSAPKPIIRVFAYDTEQNKAEFVEETLTDFSAIPKLRAKWQKIWVSVEGLGDLEVMLQLGQLFSLHRLALEDVLNTHQRAKMEPYEGSLYIAARMAVFDGQNESEQISIFLCEKFLLSYHEKSTPLFDGVRDRIRSGKGRIRIGSDYLAYALLDSIVDQNYLLLEAMGEDLDRLEDEVLERPRPATIEKIHDIKRKLTAFRRICWPFRELFRQILREDTPMFLAETQVYMRDAFDHALQLIDLLESDRESAASLVEIYLSSVSNRMNDVMKVLTLIATIFIPLSFIAGLYGMNFRQDLSPLNMPELSWYYGYPFALSLMAMTAGIMLVFFWRKGWIDFLKRNKER